MSAGTDLIAAKLAMPFFTEWQAMHPLAAENNLKRFISLVSDAIETDRKEATARIAELEAALKPFAELLRPIDWERISQWQNPDTARWSAELQVADLRAARAALSPK